jgi:hypothetical protein
MQRPIDPKSATNQVGQSQSVGMLKHVLMQILPPLYACLSKFVQLKVMIG